ncbi:Por secretion system C-terminal sorting domain-containing protein [Dyadobacter koreensis]|uniref:Por secretion system C-terminal sorting domain-containing protein n=2 Tax=Dyadobacter koreensis TaxID=408657 RepID=A0A1H7AUN8_9BACT|nr:Por secretion system C-terminal sorting domain-containing protein [Dyadobacter koreensis]
MKKILFFCLCLCFNAMSQEIDQQQTTIVDETFIEPNVMGGQSFTSGIAGYLCAVTVKVKAFEGFPPQQVIMGIYGTDESGVPIIGTALGTSSIINVVATEYTDYTFYFTTPIISSVGSKLAFGLRGLGEDYVGIAVAASDDSYAFGNRFGVGPNGFVVGSVYDTYFKTYVCPSPLPVKMSKFSAQKSGTQARLDWTTTMEENSEGFAIERSADARKWQTVGFVKSKRSNTTGVTDYAWLDETPLPAYNYYRLKQTDLDGSTELSRIAVVNFGKQDLSILYPNPVTNRLFISEPASAIQIIDRKGQVVSQTASLPEEGIDVQSLATGLYFIKFQKPDGKAQSQKFIKQ